MIYKAIIIDDEPLAISVITHYLERFANFSVVNTFTDPVLAFQFLKDNNTIDIVFTDIAMPEISGIELIKLTQNKPITFVITTSFSEYAIESFSLNVLDYLLKPISFQRFSQTINRFESQQKTAHHPIAEPAFFVKDGDEFIKILIHDIQYVQGLKDYAKIVTNNGYCLALKTLKSIQETLTPYNFMRVHKSYIVPLNKIKQYNGKCIIINNIQIPVGNSYRNNLKHFLQQNKL